MTHWNYDQWSHDAWGTKPHLGWYRPYVQPFVLPKLTGPQADIWCQVPFSCLAAVVRVVFVRANEMGELGRCSSKA
jgi:hypothetical protein